MDPKIKELTEKRKAVSDKIAVIVANSELSDEQLAEVETLEAEYASLGVEIEKAEKAAAIRDRQAKRAAESANAVTAANRKTSHGSGEPRIEGGKPAFEDDPNKGFKNHSEFLNAVIVAGKAASHGQQIKDERMQYLATAGSDEQGGYSDPYGGFLLPIGLSPNILQLQAEMDPTVGLTTQVPMDAPMVKVNARVDKNHSTSVSGGLIVYRHSETTEITPSRMQFQQLSLDSNELIGAAHASESIITDSPNSFVALLSAGFGDEFGAKILREKLRGTGTGGQYMGVLNSPCLVSVTKETNQVADTIVTENIDKMVSRCWRYGRAIWLANHDTRPQLRGLTRAVGTGGQVVPYFQTSPDGQEFLDGRPIFFTEFASTLGDAGDLILGVWSEFLEGTYQPQQQAESIHVRFLNHERTFKFWIRNCGMPWWATAMTPALSSATLSPFVVLGAR